MGPTLMNFNAFGQYEQPAEGWYPDMRIPGFKDQTVAFEDFPTAHQWLAAQIAQEELFAVATEVFFERPELLRRSHSQLYEVLATWLRVDPERLLEGAGAPRGPTPKARSSKKGKRPKK